MKKPKLIKELNMEFTKFFSDVLKQSPDLEVNCVFRQIMLLRTYKIGRKKVVTAPFSISLTMTIPSNPSMPYTDCSLSRFSVRDEQPWDVIKQDFETYEKLYHLMKTSKRQILALANAIAIANHEELVWKQIDNGWDDRGYYVDNGVRVMRNL